MFRFRIVSILVLLAVICLGLGWYADRTNLARKLDSKKPHPIKTFWEKHAYWSPSSHLNTDTDTIESQLAGHISSFEGEIVNSTQGTSRKNLRHPTTETVNEVVSLLDNDDPAIRLAAARLLALYLESVSGHDNTDQKSIQTRAFFQANLQDETKKLLGDDDPDIRAAGALLIGNLYYTRELEQVMMDAFERENEPTIKIYLAWAHYHFTN